jgi:2'-hydroxyisoflavone reductase
MGDFNATGPASRMSMAEMLYGIRAATSSAVRFTWVPESFLGAQKLAPWSDLPAWVPGDPLMYVSVKRAVAAGLTFRPLADTVRDTLTWDKARPAAERAKRAAGMSRTREAEALAAWHRTTR